MKYFIYIFFLSISFGQLTRMSFLDQSINMYLHDIVILFFIVYYLIRVLFKKKTQRQFKLTPIEKTSGIFLSVLFISLLNGFWHFTFLQNIIGFLYFGRLCLYFLLFSLLFRWINEDKNNNRKVIKKGLMFFVILTIVFSYLQYFLYPNLRNLSYLGWDPHLYRVFGLFFDTSTAGIIFVLLFFSIDRLCDRYKSVLKYAIFILILFTYARLAYLTFFISVIFHMIHKRSLKHIFFIIFMILALFFIPRPSGEGGKLTRTYTIATRIEENKKGIELWLRNPILGYGYNRLRYIRIQEVLNHAGASFPSSYITILVASGLAGLFSFIFLLSVFFRKVSFNGKLLIFVVAFSSFFDNIFLNNFIITICFILMTIV